MQREETCGGTKADGTPCRAPARFVNAESGFCPTHDPERREEVLRNARKGGEATARRNARPGLDDDELPPLNSPEVAELWLERIGRAVATGRLGHQEGRSATAAVKEWLAAFEKGRMTDRVEAMREQLEALKAGRT